MDEEYGGTFITVSDEDGNEFELEHLDTLEHEGETYMAFGIVDAEDADAEEVEVVIMHVVEQEGEELFEEVEDEALLETVYGLFMKRIEEEEGADGESE